MRGTRKGGSNSLLLTVFIAEDFRWTSIGVSYLVSSRNDMIMGSFAGIPIGASNCNINVNGGSNTVQTYVSTFFLKK